VDRQRSNKLECHVAQARRVVMACGLAGAHREELKDKRLLSLRTELRSYRLNGSGMNKIVGSTSATPCSIKRSNVHVQTCNRCSDPAWAAWWWTNPSLLRLQYLNQVRMRSIIPVPTAKHGPTRLIRLSQCPLRTNAISGLMATLQHRSRRCDAVATLSVIFGQREQSWSTK
jgi:hypothetical protein